MTETKPKRKYTKKNVFPVFDVYYVFKDGREFNEKEFDANRDLTAEQEEYLHREILFDNR